MYSVNKSAWGPRGDRYGPAIAGDREGPPYIYWLSSLAPDRSSRERRQGRETTTRRSSPELGEPHYRSRRTTGRSSGANMAKVLRRRVVALGRVSEQLVASGRGSHPPSSQPIGRAAPGGGPTAHTPPRGARDSCGAATLKIR